MTDIQSRRHSVDRVVSSNLVESSDDTLTVETYLGYATYNEWERQKIEISGFIGIDSIGALLSRVFHEERYMYQVLLDQISATHTQIEHELIMGELYIRDRNSLPIPANFLEGVEVVVNNDGELLFSPKTFEQEDQIIKQTRRNIRQLMKGREYDQLPESTRVLVTQQFNTLAFLTGREPFINNWINTISKRTVQILLNIQYPYNAMLKHLFSLDQLARQIVAEAIITARIEIEPHSPASPQIY